MATRDEVKSELMSKIDNVFPDDRELDQDGDIPQLAEAIGSTDEDVEELLNDIDAAEADDEDAGEVQENG